MAQESILVPAPELNLVNGQPLALSTVVANHFEKPHNRVLASIKEILGDIPSDLCTSNFRRTSVNLSMPNGGHRKSPAYYLTRDGFTLLAMGFTGKKALQWKLRYIQAFNAMEAKLREDALPLSPALSTVADRRPLVEACNLLVETRYLPKPVERDYAKVRADVSKFLGVDKWEDIRTEDIPKALEFVQVQISADIQVKASPAPVKPENLPAPLTPLETAVRGFGDLRRHLSDVRREIWEANHRTFKQRRHTVQNFMLIEADSHLDEGVETLFHSMSRQLEAMEHFARSIQYLAGA